jgi:hypothetical protein
MFQVLGPINNIQLSGFNLNGANKAATLIEFDSVRFSGFHNFYGGGFTGSGIKVRGLAATGNLNLMLDWSYLYLASSQTNAVGIDLDGVLANNTDTWLSTISNSRVDVSGTSAIGIKLAYSDNILFNQIHVALSGTGLCGIKFDGTNNVNFPTGHLFVKVATDNTCVAGTIGVNQFVSYGTTDGETVPNNANLIGYTDKGVFFGAPSQFVPGTSLLPGIAINDPATGLYETGATTSTGVGLSLYGASWFDCNISFTGYCSFNPTTGLALNGKNMVQLGSIVSNNTNGFETAGGAASSTGPTLVPNRSDIKAGIGADAAGDVSIITDNATVATEAVRYTGTTATHNLASTFANDVTFQHLAFSHTAPTVASGFCSTGSPVTAISASNGTAAFDILIGQATCGSTGTLTLPAATTGWVCNATDVTTPASHNIVQTGTQGSTTAVVLTDYARTTGIAQNFNPADHVHVQCTGF